MKITTSKYISVKKSSIHSTGVFAYMDIFKDTNIIQYVGDKITKKESERRSEIIISKHKDNVEHGAVYIFELNKRYDIDGHVESNTARFINHSCNPNCEAVNIDGEIWIVAMKDIDEGEELTYNYGYGFENYESHVCACLSDNCIGYILADKHWPKLSKSNKLKQKKLIAA